MNLAKMNANKPQGDEELRKKLWLRIARHVVEEEQDIKKYVTSKFPCSGFGNCSLFAFEGQWLS